MGCSHVNILSPHPPLRTVTALEDCVLKNPSDGVELVCSVDVPFSEDELNESAWKFHPATDPEVWLTFWAHEPIMTARLSGGDSNILAVKKGDLIGEFRLQ